METSTYYSCLKKEWQCYWSSLLPFLPTLAMVFKCIIYPQIFPCTFQLLNLDYGRYWRSGLWYCNGIYGFSGIGTLSGMPYCIWIFVGPSTVYGGLVCWSSSGALVCEVGLTAFCVLIFVIGGCLWWLIVTLLLSRTLQLGFLKVEFGPPYCLIYTYIIFLSKYLIVVCFNIMMTVSCESD